MDRLPASATNTERAGEKLDGIDRLELFIEPANEPSWRAAERAGYQREGTLRSWQKIARARRDKLVDSRLAGERGNPEMQQGAV